MSMSEYSLSDIAAVPATVTIDNTAVVVTKL